MAINEKAQLRVDATLAAGVTKKLQSQLNAVAKKLTLRIGKVQIQNQQFNKSIQQGLKQVEKMSRATTTTMTSNNKKQLDLVDRLIGKYKTGKMSFDEFNKAGNRYLKLKNTNLKQQAKLYQALTSASNKRNRALETEAKFNRAIAESNTTARMQAVNNQLKVQTAMAREMQRGLNRINTINRNIKDKQAMHGDAVFSSKSVQQNLNKLTSMMDTFGRKGGASLGQINEQYAKMNTSIKRVTKATREQQHSFGNMIRDGMKSMIVWGMVATALYAPLRAFQDGLETLKEIDSQLINIAKVSGRSAEQMDKLAKKASAVGVALGKTAQEYLEAVTEFTRAGYGDNAENLAELSLLLQNVGDVTSETANSMLIAVDAAYDLSGSSEELTKIIDSLNEIECCLLIR